MKIKDAALRCFNEKVIDIVTKALMTKKIKTGGAYLRTWKNLTSKEETPPAHIIQQLELGARALKRQLGSLPVRQAPEIDMIRMFHDLGNSPEEPWVKGGPIHPLWTVFLSCIFMLRSIAASSIFIEQITIDKSARVVELERRISKKAIDGKPTTLSSSALVT